MDAEMTKARTMLKPLHLLKSVAASLRNNPDYGGAIVVGYSVTLMQILLQIVLVPLYISTLGKFAFGALMVLLAYSNCSRLGLTWLSGRALRVLGSAYALGDRREYAHASNAFRIIYITYGVFAAALFLVVGLLLPTILVGVVPADQADPLRMAVVLIAVYIVGQNWLTAEVIVLAARKRQVLSQASLMISVAVFAILAIPVMLHGGNVGSIAACLVAGTIFSLIFCMFIAFQAKWADPQMSGLPRLNKIIAYVRPQAAAYAYYGFLSLLLQSDTLLVGILGGAEAAAHFVLVWKIAEVGILLLWRFCDILQPELIHMDLHGDHHRITRIYAKGIRILAVIGIVGGLGYALLGPTLVRLWVGVEVAPNDTLPFALAGGAILWLTIARLPSVLVFSLGRLKVLNAVTSVEVVARLVLTIMLFPVLSFMAPLVAINTTHLLGISHTYYRMGKLALVVKPGFSR